MCEWAGRAAKRANPQDAYGRNEAVNKNVNFMDEQTLNVVFLL